MANYDPLDRMHGLALLSCTLPGDDARRVADAVGRMYARGPWRIDGVPTRWQLRDGYCFDGTGRPVDLPRAKLR